MSRRRRHILMERGYWVYKKVRDRFVQDCDGVCTYCGREVITGMFGGDLLGTIDHKIPLSRGGTWKRYNLTCACRRCNTQKGNMTAEEYMALPAYMRDWFID